MRASGVKAKVERAAIELFAAKGFEGVSIADIAVTAGVSQGALYRHYRSKEDMAAQLFAAAYLRVGAQLETIRAGHAGFAARIAAMVAQFCALYDSDAALFRFLLIAQHDLLPHVGHDRGGPVAVIVHTVAEAIDAGEILSLDPAVAAAAIMGVVLQTAIFHVYGRVSGPLLPRAAALARAAIAAVTALPVRTPS